MSCSLVRGRALQRPAVPGRAGMQGGCWRQESACAARLADAGAGWLQRRPAASQSCGLASLLLPRPASDEGAESHAASAFAEP